MSIIHSQIAAVDPGIEIPAAAGPRERQISMSTELLAAFVLYVEDEALTQHVVEAGLTDAGFAVIVASDADEGLEILKSRGTELIGLVTDIKLGKGLDGWAVARQARELYPNLPVVYVSGTDGHEWTAQGVPCSVMISKPFAPAQVVVAISSLLNTGDPQK